MQDEDVEEIKMALKGILKALVVLNEKMSRLESCVTVSAYGKNILRVSDQGNS